MPVFDNAQIDERHFIAPAEWFGNRHSFTELNDFYVREAIELAKEVAEGVLTSCAIAPSEVSAIIFVSTTGISTPSIDARLFNRMPFDRHIVRMPIWGLGCAGGAAGISRAFDYSTAHPDAIVLVISVEICSLAFQNRPTKENVIAASLFGDGAAAAIIVGDNVQPRSKANFPTIIDTLSTTYPDTLDVMGWQISNEGFQVLLSKDIPTIVRELVHSNINELLEKNGLTLSNIENFVTHPGGTKVLDAYQSALGLSDKAMENTKAVLRANGNMSSATIFFILKRFMESNATRPGSYGLLSALGPGFSSELILVQW